MRQIKRRTTEQSLRNLARWIGTAPESAEHDCFAGASALDPAALAGPMAGCDAAIRLFHRLLPDFGFQLGLPPPLAGHGRSAFALAWKRGDAGASPHLAATPALALLRATVTEHANRIEREAMRHCPDCGGVGWFVTGQARRQRCHHEGLGPKASVPLQIL